MNFIISKNTEILYTDIEYTVDEIFDGPNLSDYIKIYFSNNQEDLEDYQYIPFYIVKKVNDIVDFTTNIIPIYLNILETMFNNKINYIVLNVDESENNINKNIENTYKFIFTLEYGTPLYVNDLEINAILKNLNVKNINNIAVFSNDILTYLVLDLIDKKNSTFTFTNNGLNFGNTIEDNISPKNNNKINTIEYPDEINIIGDNISHKNNPKNNTEINTIEDNISLKNITAKNISLKPIGDNISRKNNPKINTEINTIEYNFSPKKRKISIIEDIIITKNNIKINKIVKHHSLPIWYCNKSDVKKLKTFTDNIYKSLHNKNIKYINNPSIEILEIFELFNISSIFSENNVIFFYEIDPFNLEWINFSEQIVIKGLIPSINIYSNLSLKSIKTIYFNYLNKQKYQNITGRFKYIKNMIENITKNDNIITLPICSSKMYYDLIDLFILENTNIFKEPKNKIINMLPSEGQVVILKNKYYIKMNDDNYCFLIDGMEISDKKLNELQNLWDDGYYTNEWQYNFMINTEKMSKTCIVL